MIGAAQWDLFSKHIKYFHMSTINDIIPVSLALVVSLDSGLRVALSTTALYSARSASSGI
jgi:hypothetical protein